MVLQVHSTSEPAPLVKNILDGRAAQLAWWVGPSTPNIGLEKALREHGLALAEELTGMALNLNDLTEPAQPLEGFTAVPVVDDQQLVDWCRIMTQVSEFPDLASEAWLDMCRGINILRHDQWRFYLGLWNGKPISTASLFRSNGVAGIHSVTTLPEFRGAGFGSAITLAPLSDAKRTGFSQAVLYSSPMAVNLYRRLGFREHGKGRIYLWDKPA